VPDVLKTAKEEEEQEPEVAVIQKPRRGGVNNFWGKFKNSLIEIFKEEEDRQL
jgi:cell division protein FtsA